MTSPSGLSPKTTPDAASARARTARCCSYERRGEGLLERGLRPPGPCRRRRWRPPGGTLQQEEDPQDPRPSRRSKDCLTSPGPGFVHPHTFPSPRGRTSTPRVESIHQVATIARSGEGPPSPHRQLTRRRRRWSAWLPGSTGTRSSISATRSPIGDASVASRRRSAVSSAGPPRSRGDERARTDRLLDRHGGGHVDHRAPRPAPSAVALSPSRRP